LGADSDLMRYFAALLLIFICRTALCQDITNQYDDFGGAVTTGNEEKALFLAQQILPEVESLNARQQAIFYYKLAGLYEGLKKNEQAIEFYERSLKLEPDYYVPHLALGYLYLGQANPLARQLNAEKNNPQLRDKYLKEYQATLRKALPFLEKAMACDPNDQVLQSITVAYRALKDETSLTSLETRLQSLRKNCVTVLKED
jgi:tetratricopeptide (TPR) repeat protein